MKKVITITQEEFREKIISESVEKINHLMDTIIEAMIIIFLFFYIGAMLTTNTQLQSVISGVVGLFVIFNIFVLVIVKRRLRKYLEQQCMEEE